MSLKVNKPLPLQSILLLCSKRTISKDDGGYQEAHDAILAAIAADKLSDAKRAEKDAQRAVKYAEKLTKTWGKCAERVGK